MTLSSQGNANRIVRLAVPTNLLLNYLNEDNTCSSSNSLTKLKQSTFTETITSKEIVEQLLIG